MQYLSLLPNIDDQSLLHRGDWPYGRTNHYFFDLNRDFFYSTQPETQGRVKLILMGPPSQPLNTNISPSLQEWARVFARDQGEWFENWYPGESNYTEYRGSMHILYEQSTITQRDCLWTRVRYIPKN